MSAGKKVALLLGAFALAFLAVGCGGSDNSSSTSSLTKAEFVKQADKICAKSESRLEEETDDWAKEHGVDTSKPSEKQKEEVIGEVVAPNIAEQAEQIAELGAPKGDEEKIEAMLAAVEEGASEAESDPKSLIEGDNAIEKGSKLAREYGLKECGS